MLMKNKVLLAFLMSSFAVGTCKYSQSESEEDLVRNRIWVDAMPRDDRSIVNYFLVVAEEGTDEGLGLILGQSTWFTERHMFIWSQDDEAIEFDFPQFEDDADASDGSITPTASACKAPEPFELCLTLDVDDDGGRITHKKFFSRYEWVVDPSSENLSSLDVHALIQN